MSSSDDDDDDVLAQLEVSAIVSRYHCVLSTNGKVAPWMEGRASKDSI